MMAERVYTASLSKSQGRAGWSIIFRHPVRRDKATGKRGLRIRRGLNTQDETRAKDLRGQLNEILADTKYHDIAARGEAERRFDAAVVEIFYDKMVPEETDFWSLRGDIYLPDSVHDDYRRVLLLGPTGAGKTTLLRQLIGIDPKKERFPATSTAKTTVHDIEVIISDGLWRVIATFATDDEVRDHLNECVSAAVLAAWRGETDGEILRRLLSHVNQRFRFNYVLGNGPIPTTSDFDDDDVDQDDPVESHETEHESGKIDLTSTNELLARCVQAVKAIAAQHGDALRTELAANKTESDERVIDELFEEQLDNILRDDEEFHGIADDLMEEIEARFELLDPDGLKRTKQGWPISWSWETPDRSAFLRIVSRFSSNEASLFGQLLTPLVNGVRVAGPFAANWSVGNSPNLVLLDGEGLGHTPKSSSSVSTSVSRRIGISDAVLLVDNATQPMQAACIAAMRELVTSGNASKLILAFTHFDKVVGDNIPTPSARAQHVVASAENVLAAIGEDLGPFAERALRNRLETARVFLSGIMDPISVAKKEGARTVDQLGRLLKLIDEVVERPRPTKARPKYDRMNLVLAVKSAAQSFHDIWFPRLGLEYKGGFAKEHWTRVKALSRRLATGRDDHYDTLHPVADLRKELQDRVYVLLQNPIEWEGAEPNEDEKQALYDDLAERISRRMLDLATKRVWKDRTEQWQLAYGEFGPGSTFVRAQIIGSQIYDPAAPIPDITPSLDRNQFLREVADEVQQAADEVGVMLI